MDLGEEDLPAGRRDAFASTSAALLSADEQARSGTLALHHGNQTSHSEHLQPRELKLRDIVGVGGSGGTFCYTWPTDNPCHRQETC